MLKFDEQERPSFIELAKLVLTSTENTIDSPKGGIHKHSSHGVGAKSQEQIQKKGVNKAFSNQNLKENNNALNIDQSSTNLILHKEKDSLKSSVMPNAEDS